MIPQVRGFQGCYLDNHRNNWRCARAVPALCETAPLDLGTWGVRGGVRGGDFVPTTEPPPPPPARVKGGTLLTRGGGGGGGAITRGACTRTPPPIPLDSLPCGARASFGDRSARGGRGDCRAFWGAHRSTLVSSAPTDHHTRRPMSRCT